MKIQCLIIDDEPLAVSLIESYISKFSQLEIVATTSNAIQGFEILKSKHIDLVFLDIQMPVIDGIEFLKSLNNPPKVIFTTAYREYAIESYELNVIDYLLKPISFDRFLKAVNKYFESTKIKVQENYSNKNEINDHLYVNMNKKHYKILFDDIVYAESLKDYVQIHTTNKVITTKKKISAFEQTLPSSFLRVHRSYIVNTNKITAYTANDIELEQIEIPIGVSYKHFVFDFLQTKF